MIHSNSKWTIASGVIYEVSGAVRCGEWSWMGEGGRRSPREPYFAVLFVWFGQNKKEELTDGWMLIVVSLSLTQQLQ